MGGQARSHDGEWMTCTCRYMVMGPMQNGTLHDKPRDQLKVPFADSILRWIEGSYARDRL